MAKQKKDSATGDRYTGPVFQAFTVKTTPGRPGDKVKRAVAAVLGRGWTIQSYGGRRDRFEVLKGDGALAPDEAWRLTYLLRGQKGIASAEPVFRAMVSDRAVWDEPAA